MSTTTNDIVKVMITRENARLISQGFGIPLLLGKNNRTEELITAYSSPDEMLADGYKVTDELYLMAQAAMRQELSPEQFYIGRVKGDSNALQKITLDAAPTAGTFTLILGLETTAAINFDASNTDIKAALELLSAISEVTVVGDATDAEFTVEFTGADANTAFDTLSIEIGSLTGTSLAIIDVEQYGSENETYVDALINIWDENRLWYTVCTENRTESVIEAIADWIEDKNKLYFVSTDIAAIPTSSTTDIASVLRDKGYKKTVIMYSKDTDGYADCSWVGGQLPKTVGSITWAFKELVGTTPDNDLKTSEINYMKAKNVNYYETIAGLNSTSNNAVVVGGEYIDIMRGIHWLEARISENVFAGMYAREKVPYTDKGIGYIVSKIRAVLELAYQENQFINPDYTITFPSLKDVPTANKTARLLESIEAQAQAQGAIHNVIITAKVFD